MASKVVKITIRVVPSRASETISWRVTGRFRRLSLAGYTNKLVGQGLTTSTTRQAFTSSVLQVVQNDVGLHP